MNNEFLERAKIDEKELYLIRVEGSSIVGRIKIILTTKRSSYLSIENPRVITADGFVELIGKPTTIPLYETPSFLYQIKDENIISIYEKSIPSLIYKPNTIFKN